MNRSTHIFSAQVTGVKLIELLDTRYHMAQPEKKGKKVIFRPYITDPKTGKRRYPKKGKVFPILVDDK